MSLAPGHPTGRILAGIGLVVLATACFAMLDTATKYASASVPVAMALWVRYALQASLTSAVVLPLRGRAVLKTRQPWRHGLRGVLLLSTSVLAYFSLQHMPVAEFTAIVMISPLVITVLAATVLGEKVSGLRWVLVCTGFVGALLIIRPGAQTFSWASLLPLALVACNAWFQILTSRMARTESPETIHLYSGWTGAALASLVLPMFWTHLSDWHLWAILGFVGVAGTVGHFMLILGYGRAPAAILTPYLYAQIAFAMFAGWLAFAQWPDPASLTGIGLIVGAGAAGAWLTLREGHIPMPVRKT